MSQSIQCVAKPQFSKKQIADIAQFEKDLKAGNVDIIFTGTFEDGIQFLKDTGDFVDTFNHA